MTNREQELVNVSRDALRWLHNKLRGTGLNGPSDDLGIARELDRVLASYGDVAPISDSDKHYPVPSFADEQATRYLRSPGVVRAYLDRQEAERT